MDDCVDAQAPAADWRTRLQAQWEALLAQLPDDVALDQVPPGMAAEWNTSHSDGSGPDLYTLLREMTALRQEIRLQNREQGKAVREFQETRRHFSEHLLRADAQTLRQAEERARALAVQAWAKTLLPVRDALSRGLQVARTALERRRRSFWHHLWPTELASQESLVQGYEMALNRLAQSLEGQGIMVIKTVGERFDPSCMTAVETTSDAAFPEQYVVHEVTSGFSHGRSLIRCAEVVVNVLTK
jgi:molecular chaperone GrpE